MICQKAIENQATLILHHTWVTCLDDEVLFVLDEREGEIGDLLGESRGASLVQCQLELAVDVGLDPGAVKLRVA